MVALVEERIRLVHGETNALRLSDPPKANMEDAALMEQVVANMKDLFNALFSHYRLLVSHRPGSKLKCFWRRSIRGDKPHFRGPFPRSPSPAQHSWLLPRPTPRAERGLQA